MNGKKDCKIVQDLLPNYIENLTNEETNEFINKHLKSCEECKKIYDSMNKDFTVNNKYREKKKVNFLKKYRNKLRVLELIILIIVVAFVVNTGRKMFIITDLQNKSKEYANSSNYHSIAYSVDKGNYTKTEVFNLEDKQKVILTTLSKEGKKQIVTMYGTKITEDSNTHDTETNPRIARYRQNIYSENENKKETMQNFEVLTSEGIQESFWGVDGLKDLIITSITTSINKTTFDGKDCYYISGIGKTYGNTSMFIDEDTGLIICTMASEFKNSDGTIERLPSEEYEYEFGTVTENEFMEPDISEYKVIENK